MDRNERDAINGAGTDRDDANSVVTPERDGLSNIERYWRDRRQSRDLQFAPDGRDMAASSSTIPPAALALRDFSQSSFAARESKGGVMVRQWVLHATQDPSERLVLARLAYWFGRRKYGEQPRACLKFDGFYWVAKSVSELAEELSMAERTVRRALKRLTRKVILIATVKRFSGSPTNHYRISVEGVERATAAGVGDPRAGGHTRKSGV